MITRTTFFLLVFALFAVAILFRSFRGVRRGAVLVLVMLVIVFGVTGTTLWPFFGWHLYGQAMGTEQSYHEFRVVDGDGTVLTYDPAAARPAIATPMTRHAGRLVESNASYQQTVGCYLLSRSEQYRQTRRAGTGLTDHLTLGFPKHQYGNRWNASEIGALGPIRELRVYAVELTFSPTGTAIESYRDQSVWSLRASSCL